MLICSLDRVGIRQGVYLRRLRRLCLQILKSVAHALHLPSAATVLHHHLPIQAGASKGVQHCLPHAHAHRIPPSIHSPRQKKSNKPPIETTQFRTARSPHLSQKNKTNLSRKTQNLINKKYQILIRSGESSQYESVTDACTAVRVRDSKATTTTLVHRSTFLFPTFPAHPRERSSSRPRQKKPKLHHQQPSQLQSPQP